MNTNWRLNPVFQGLVLGLALLATESARAEPIAQGIQATSGTRGLGTVVNGGSGCGSGACQVTGGTGAGGNLFHRFNSFDTRGAITGVTFHNTGFNAVMVGVLNPTVIDKAVALSQPGSLFWLSPGGISLQAGGSFQNVTNLTLSTATGLRVGSGVFDAWGTTAEQATLLSGVPLLGRQGLVSEAETLGGMGLLANGDLSIDGGLLTVDQSLLLDAQGGHVLLAGAQLTAGESLHIHGDALSLEQSALDVSNGTGLGGEVRLEGQQIALRDVAIDASGRDGGGTILVGGGLTGADPSMTNALQTSLDAASTLRADALSLGDGGLIVAYASEVLDLSGAFSAQAGSQGGSGGLIETSAATIFFRDGLAVTTAAPSGRNGLWWIDPTDISIQANPGGGPARGNIIRVADLVSILNSSSTDVRVSTSGFGDPTDPSNDLSKGSDFGDITLRDPLNWSGDSRLILDADQDIVLQANISSTGLNGGLLLKAGRDIAADSPSVDIFTEGDQIYDGRLVINSGNLLSLRTGNRGTGGIGFFGEIEGPGGLSVDLGSSNGRVVFNEAVGQSSPLARLVVGSEANPNGRTYINANIATSGEMSFYNDAFIGVRGVGSFINSGFDQPFNLVEKKYTASEFKSTGFKTEIPGWDVYLQRLVFGLKEGDARSQIDGFDVPLDGRNVLDIKAGAQSRLSQGSPLILAGCFDDCGLDPSRDTSRPYTFRVQNSEIKSDTREGNEGSILMFSDGWCDTGYCIVNGPYIVSQGTVFLAEGDTVSFNWTAFGGGDDYNVNAFLLDPVSGKTIPLLNSTGGSVQRAWSDASIDSVISQYNQDPTKVGTWSINQVNRDWITSSVTLDSSATAGNYKFVFVSGSYDGTGGRLLGASMQVDSIVVSSPQSLDLFKGGPLPTAVVLKATAPGSSIRFAGNVENRVELSLESQRDLHIHSLGGPGAFTGSAPNLISISGDQLGASSNRLRFRDATQLELRALGDIYAAYSGSAASQLTVDSANWVGVLIFNFQAIFPSPQIVLSVLRVV
jgi:hypothetical protein